MITARSGWARKDIKTEELARADNSKKRNAVNANALMWAFFEAHPLPVG
jgi:hypothetical protein